MRGDERAARASSTPRDVSCRILALLKWHWQGGKWQVVEDAALDESQTLVAPFAVQLRRDRAEEDAAQSVCATRQPGIRRTNPREVRGVRLAATRRARGELLIHTSGDDLDLAPRRQLGGLNRTRGNRPHPALFLAELEFEQDRVGVENLVLDVTGVERQGCVSSA